MKPNIHDARFMAAKLRPTWAQKFSADLGNPRMHLHAAINKRAGVRTQSDSWMEWGNVVTSLRARRDMGGSLFQHMRERTRWFSAQPNKRLTTYRRILVRAGVRA